MTQDALPGATAGTTFGMTCPATAPWTSTANWAVVVVSFAPVAVQVTRVVPMGKSVPDAGVQTASVTLGAVVAAAVV
jgi:hypothetical protein